MKVTLDGASHALAARRQPMYHRVFRAENIAVRAALLELRVRFDNQVDDEIIGRLELALAEVLNNICEHGGIAMSLTSGPREPLGDHAQDHGIAPQAQEQTGTAATLSPLTIPLAGAPFAERPSPAAAETASRAPTIHLCVIRQSHGLACAVTDDGIPLPEDCLLPFGDPTFSTYRSREDDGGELPEGGFGWYLIQDLTHAMCYYREDHRNFLAFTVPFSADADADRDRSGDPAESEENRCAPCGPLTGAGTGIAAGATIGAAGGAGIAPAGPARDEAAKGSAS